MFSAVECGFKNFVVDVVNIKGQYFGGSKSVLTVPKARIALDYGN
jgi:hypothetical protein